MEEPLDFEQEDLLSHAPRLPIKRKKAIGLDDLLSDFYGGKKDDLLSDFYGGKKKTMDKCSRHGYDSDEDDKRVAQNETYLRKFVEDCEKQASVNEIGSEDDVPIWGRRAFGTQKAFPQLEKPVTANSDFFRHFSETGFASIFDSNVENFLEGLLTNGWLSHLVAATGSLEDSIASWTFHTMLYSSAEDLHVSACDFWCSILRSENKGDQPLAKLGWIPSYSVLKDAISNYGYLWPTCNGTGCEISQGQCRFQCKDFSNILGHWYQIFSTTEMQELLEVAIWFYLDRHLLGLALELNGCFHSIVHYFLDAEWEDSCAKVAASIALRVPKDLNCLRIVECITGTDNRTKYLKSQLALHLLIVCFDNKVKSAEEILELLASVNLKENSCDFFKLYIYLVLTENLLLLYHPFQEKSKVVDLWYQYLRNCSTQITSTDWRSYASKVRNKASYLLQNMALKSSS
ncbi:hypothetical protein FCM35_KLT19729 [Carex littledalei]|uniref:Coiled-coil SMC6 And NSE5 INteracting (CANIN) domain-containing protein n=1 Tax=Carex littledalei TaxID=544730 RepID=A0A833R6J0_9POAL|nr:hypothetical protein FCM35_KLT19729 [Carex littledalei]